MEIHSFSKCVDFMEWNHSIVICIWRGHKFNTFLLMFLVWAWSICVFSCQACKGEDLGKVEFDEEIKKRFKMVYVPNWFSVDLKTGVSESSATLTFSTSQLLVRRLIFTLCRVDAHHHFGRERLLRCLGVGEGRRLFQFRWVRPQAYVTRHTSHLQHLQHLEMLNDDGKWNFVGKLWCFLYISVSCPYSEFRRIAASGSARVLAQNSY